MTFVDAISIDVKPALNECSSIARTTKPQEKFVTCQICFSNFDEFTLVSKICKASCPAIICKYCVSDYIRIYTESTPSGVLRSLKCPVCVSPTNLMRWKSMLSNFDISISNFESKVQAACCILCPNCHALSNFLPCTRETTNSIKLLPNIASKLPELRRLGELYCRHKVSLQELWTFLKTEFPNHYLELVNRMIPLIHDIERRAGLFLRMMRSSPFVYSTCCNVPICFNCKTLRHHDGISCSAMLKEIEDIAVCPDCNLTLVKGDGCNWITCYCGHSFEWGKALMTFQFSQITPKALDRLKAVLKIYVIKHRFRLTVVPCLLRDANIRLYKSTFQTVSSYLRRKRWMVRFKVNALPSAMAKFILMDIKKQTKPMLAVCEYLRHLTWRKKFKELLSSESFQSAIEKHQIQQILSTRQDVTLAMKKILVKIRRSFVLIRMKLVLDQLTQNMRWMAVRLNMDGEERDYIDEEMASIFAIDDLFSD